MDGHNVEELLSVLSKATGASSSRSSAKASSRSVASNATSGSSQSRNVGKTPQRRQMDKVSAENLTLDDVLSPNTREHFLKMTESQLEEKRLKGSVESVSGASELVSFESASSKAAYANEDLPLPPAVESATKRQPFESYVSSVKKDGQSMSSSTSIAIDDLRLDVSDESEIDAQLAHDPTVVCYEDKIVLRSSDGPCLAISHDKKPAKKAATLDDTSFSVGGGTNSVRTASILGTSAPQRKPRSSSISSVYSTLSQVPTTRTLAAVANGNPTETACEFLVVGTNFRSQSGAIKHGEIVALMSKACSRYLGVYSREEETARGEDWDDDLDSSGLDSDDDLLDNFDLNLGKGDRAENQWKVGARRKIAGRREHWMVVEVPNETPERGLERESRLAASIARMTFRAKQLGYNVNHKSIVPNKMDIPVSLRSNDTILLKSVHAESLYLSSVRGKVCLRRLPNAADVAKWAVAKVPAPFLPLWSRERPLLNALPDENRNVSNILSSHDKSSKKSAPNGNETSTKPKSRFEIESDLLNDLLYALQGIEGEYITRQGGQWQLNSEAIHDRALSHLAEKMLPMCNNFVVVENYIQKRSRAEYGRVSHALSAAMRALLREYQVLIAQLEHQMQLCQLSVQKLWFYIQPSMRVVEVLAQVSRRTSTATGGALLNALHRLVSRGGDAKARSVHNYLIQHATVPYLEMLELWVYHGVIRDPYNEFMVCVDEEASKKTLRDDFNARYWDARYTLRRSDKLSSSSVPLRTSLGIEEGNEESSQTNPHVPFFLARIADKVLTTGKYLNVVRECGRWVNSDTEQRIPYSDESHAYDQIVSRAHDFASRTLLALLLEEEKLIARLRSIKHYFLLDQGDFFVHFMDLANEELRKPVQQIAVSRLQSLLEMCLRVRNVNDPYQEELACELVPYGLIQHVEAIHTFAEGRDASQMDPQASVEELRVRKKLTEMHGLNGVDAFTLDFKVRWPLSLVLSRQALTKYQLIFRHLFFCKHVERQLCTTWRSHQTTKELNLRSALGPEFSLRQRMLHFLQNFEYYVMFEVLEPRWHEFEQRLAKVKTVDDLMIYHSEFLDTCLRECLLTHQGLLKTLAKIMTTCLLFAEQIGRFTEQVQVDENSMRAVLKEREEDEDLQRPKQRRPPRRGDPDAEALARHRRNQNLRKARIKVQEQHIRSLVTQKSYRDMIRKNEETFDQMLNTFMDDLVREATHGEYHSHLTNLCTRLDFNSYYKK